jgi:L-alanine-DL-glutamate epimerase-like enolase superfamily enzyme
LQPITAPVASLCAFKKISDMADTYKIPTAPHTGGGPILWFSSIHTATSLTNFYIMESVCRKTPGETAGAAEDQRGVSWQVKPALFGFTCRMVAEHGTLPL